MATPTKSLLEAIARHLPSGYHAPAASAGELREMTRRTYLRDLDKIGIRGAVADTIVARTLAAIRLTLEDDAVSLADRQAACLVGERVLVAVASTMAGVWLAEEDAAAAASGPSSPIAD